MTNYSCLFMLNFNINYSIAMHMRYLTTLIMSFGLFLPALGQSDINQIVGMPLADAHEKLLDMGFEIAHSSLFSADQLWYNEDQNQCISFTFTKDDPHTVKEIEPGKEKKCIRGVRAARRVWLNYRDGGADASSPDINREREKLRNEGYVVSYWVNNVSPGKTMEVWYNESAQLSKSISWDNSTKSNIKVLDRDPRLGKNPAPIYNDKNM